VRLYLKNKPGTVVHHFNPNYYRGGDKRITVQRWLGQKHKTLKPTKDWGNGSSNRTLALQGKLNPQYHTHTKKMAVTLFA
jgi:hypothetical protein